MAKLSDVPARLRDHARKVPADVLEALCPEELNCRAQRAAELSDLAYRLAIGNDAGFLRASYAVMEAEPVWNFIQNLRELSRQAGLCSGDVEREIRSVRTDYEAKGEYPPGLREAVEAACINQAPDPYLADVANAIVAHHSND